MNPFKFGQLMKHLVRAKQKKPDLPEVFRASDAPIPEETLTRDMFKEAQERFKNSKAGGGMLVQPGFDGTRQGYASDYSPEERKQQAERGERVYETYKGKRVLGLNKDQKKWYNKTHKNNPNSRFYKKDWNELGGKKSDLLDSYFNEQKREKPPKGYITTKEFSKKYNFPIYAKKEYGPGRASKAESNFINNALMKTIGEKEASKGRKNLFLKKFLIDNLEPKQFDTLVDLGDGKKSVQKVNYVKDNAALAKKVRTYIDSPSIDPKTIENMNLVLGNTKIKSLFNKGDYKGLVKALGEVENLTNSERANVMLRVSQAMSGVNFRDFNHNIKANKVSAKKIFKGLETGRAGIPTEYNDAYKRLKHNTIKDAIGEDYFTKSYQGFIDDSRAALKKAGIDITNIDLNEITGLSSGYKNQTFSSTQFVNFMDRTFNQGAHASMIGEYGRYETALQTALKNGTVDFKGETFTPRQLINNWQQWRSGWYDRLDPQYKTKAVRDILPTFTLGKDPYASVISKKRLAELAGLNLNIREEGIRAGYAKTFPTIGSQAVLKEAVNVKKGSPLYKQLEKSLASFSANPKCRKSFSKGGRIGYATGPASLSECAISGRNRLEKVIKTGAKLGPNEATLATQILRAGRSLGSAFTLSGLFGPAAIAFTAAAEAGIVGYDMLTTGNTLKESIGSGLLNYALGDKTKINLQEETLKRFGTLPGMTEEKLAGITRVLDQTNKINTMYKKSLDVENLEKQVKADRAEPRDTFMSPDDDLQQTDQAIRTEQKLEDEKQNLLDLKNIYTKPDPSGVSPFESYLKDYESGAFEKAQKDLAEANRLAAIQKLESRGPVIAGILSPKFEEGRQQDLLTLRSIINPASAFAIKSYENPESTFQPVKPFGLAGGGIAKLAGIDQGPQTESMNPDSQGLPGILKRGIKR